MALPNINPNYHFLRQEELSFKVEGTSPKQFVGKDGEYSFKMYVDDCKIDPDFFGMFGLSGDYFPTFKFTFTIIVTWKHRIKAWIRKALKRRIF